MSAPPQDDAILQTTYPLEWPEGVCPPLSRRALIRLVVAQCQAVGLVVPDWETPLGRERTEQWEQAGERILDTLQLSLPLTVSEHASLSELVAQVEALFLTEWRAIQEASLPEDGVILVIGVALGKPLTGTERITELLPEGRLAGFWSELPPPWKALWPEVPLKTIWWPLTTRTWASVAGVAILSNLLWRNSEVSVGSRLILAGIVGWLAWTFGVEQPARPVWPKTRGTVREVAQTMLAELHAPLHHWETLEREWA